MEISLDTLTLSLQCEAGMGIWVWGSIADSRTSRLSLALAWEQDIKKTGDFKLHSTQNLCGRCEHNNGSDPFEMLCAIVEAL